MALVQVAPKLWLHPGAPDFEQLDILEQKGWAILSCAKEPWYRWIKGESNPEDPEYLSARRGNRLYLNMIDADRSDYFQTAMIDTALEFMSEQQAAERLLLVHCNMGLSRSPSLMMLYLGVTGVLPPNLQDAEVVFRMKYPAYEPSPGIANWLVANWTAYV